MGRGLRKSTPQGQDLNRAFNAGVPVNSQEHMKVVPHHYEVVQFELAGQGVRPKHVNKKARLRSAPQKIVAPL
jgi:hypothetical protein